MKERYLIITIVALAAMLLAACYGLMAFRLDHLREMRARAEEEAKFMAGVNEQMAYSVGILEGLAVSMSPYPRAMKRVGVKDK